MKKTLLILMLSVSLMSYGQLLNTNKLENKKGVYYEINKFIHRKTIGYYESGKIKSKGNLIFSVFLVMFFLTSILIFLLLILF